MHVLQSALVHVNTRLMQEALAEPKWADSPLFWTHVNPYGRFEPYMNSRLDLDLTCPSGRRGPACALAWRHPARRDHCGAGHLARGRQSSVWISSLRVEVCTTRPCAPLTIGRYGGTWPHSTSAMIGTFKGPSASRTA